MVIYSLRWWVFTVNIVKFIALYDTKETTLYKTVLLITNKYLNKNIGNEKEKQKTQTSIWTKKLETEKTKTKKQKTKEEQNEDVLHNYPNKIHLNQ